MATLPATSQEDMRKIVESFIGTGVIETIVTEVKMDKFPDFENKCWSHRPTGVQVMTITINRG